MKTNVGGMDRNARFVIGILLLLAGLLAPLDTIVRVILLILAAVALVTATVRFCPLNALLKIDTSKPQ